MAQFKTFSFRNANAIFGVLEITGWAEVADCLSIVLSTPQFEKVVGADGSVARVQSGDNSCTITIKLLQTSTTNKELMALYLADRETGAGALPFVYADTEAGETVVVNNAWVTQAPDITRGAGHNPMEWVLEGDFMTPVFV